MKNLILLLSLALAMPAVAATQATPPVPVETKAAGPVEMTYQEVYDVLVFELGFTPEEGVYILTHTEYYRNLLYYIALAKGALPYQG